MKNFNLGKGTINYIRKFRVTYRLNTRRNTLKHTVIKLKKIIEVTKHLNLKHKEGLRSNRTVLRMDLLNGNKIVKQSRTLWSKLPSPMSSTCLLSVETF